MTQRHIGALFVGVWLVCAALLLNGAVIRIPPARPSAVRVQAAGVASTGTGTGIDGLVAEYLAANYNGTTGTWSDSSGNNLHATQGTAGSRPTASGSAVWFDGDDFVTIPADAKIGTSVWCMVYKARISAWRSQHSEFMARGTYPNTIQCFCWQGANRSNIHKYVGGADNQCGDDGLSLLGVVNVYMYGDDGSRPHASLNAGSSFKYSGVHADYDWSGQTTTIGRIPLDGAAYAFEGDLYWLRFYDRVLTQSEIQRLIDEG